MKSYCLACLFIVSFPFLVLGYTKVPIHDCGTRHATLSRLEVYPCQKDICIFKRGENVTMIADFVPRIETKDLKITVSQLDWYFGLETQIAKGFNICGKWNVTCPSESNRVQNVYFNHKLPESLPGNLKLYFKIILFGDDKQMLCKIVPMEIQ